MRSPRAETFTRVIDAVFACNGGFLAAGDALTEPAGLTAAQWQVLGYLEDGPATAAEVARRRGLRRQSVQETVNRLLRNGMLDRLPNPGDARAPLLSLTRRARDAMRKLGRSQVEWAEGVAAEVPEEDLETTLRTLRRLRELAAQPRL
ncbi:MarR family winged helix-turn-helix transcriptional regulator [Amycolatopsis sp. SID8362]|uniref:MarR family winged helix-turn-helix transcriptional regulator n=1 Tax=Amycolatopsis sp. SID8362 TaxID=2690346 RepID=UPI001371E2D3|nr:MarR family winged helix-turn-helix transcriptional regulator [Amycolatopsis sp. SID8362]NBH11012.1 MarR family transcriptional regulator [Amycolatopsis sp. SID8362]NED47703.1 winged helix-turn-helix transcriptional regulator [Amycolatopsis sp. SID8362]